MSQNEFTYLRRKDLDEPRKKFISLRERLEKTGIISTSSRGRVLSFRSFQ